jgi:DNA-binding CsgD family transcriptional regulator
MRNTLPSRHELSLLEDLGAVYEALFARAPLARPLQDFFSRFDTENFTLRQWDGHAWRAVTHTLPIQTGIHVDDFVLNDPWASKLDSLSREQFHIDEEILPHGEFINTPYYQELIRPNKINHHALVSIFTAGERTYRLCLFRPRAQQDNSFRIAEKKLWNGLLPMLRRMLRVGQEHIVLMPPRFPDPVPPLWNAELRLMAGLAAGMSLRDYAARTKISLHTARWYVKSALRKTNLHAQAELIAHLADRYRDRHWYRLFLREL